MPFWLSLTDEGVNIHHEAHPARLGFERMRQRSIAELIFLLLNKTSPPARRLPNCPRMPPSEATLSRLHAEHALSVYRFAWSVTKDEMMARDVVQELFLKLARDVDAVAKARSERAVIFTMVRNLALDALRRRAREEKALQTWGQELPGWFEPAADHETLTAALAELPEEQRSVVHLHVWEDMAFREIGELLGQPTQTIASRYRYALEKLRAHKHTLV
jgi:RNA polymerase sigma-70 factor (ECF subfamily)